MMMKNENLRLYSYYELHFFLKFNFKNVLKFDSKIEIEEIRYISQLNAYTSFFTHFYSSFTTKQIGARL